MAEKGDKNFERPATQAAKVDAETAQLEVERFLDYKRVPDHRRKDQFEGPIKELVALVVADRLVFDFEKKRATYKLFVPLKSQSGDIHSISMRFSIGVQESLNALKNIDAGDTLARSLVMAATLSGNNPNVFRNNENDLGDKGFDVMDNNMLINYTSFFLA